MKYLARCSILLLMCLFCGCLPSLHPLYTEDSLIKLPGLIGIWSNMQEEEDAETWSFTQYETDSYRLHISRNNTEDDNSLIVHVCTLGSAMFLDCYPEEPAIENDFYKMHLIPAHIFMKVTIEGDVMKLSLMDYEWLDKKLKKKPELLQHERLENDQILLTASTENLQKFFLKYSRNKDAFSDPGLMRRVK